MIKICHLSSVHQVFDDRIFLKECISLTKAYEVHLVIPAEKDMIVEGVKIHCVSKSNSRIQRMTSIVYKLYKKALCINAELYHFHDPELIFVGFLLKLSGKKVIYDIHEDVPEQIMTKEWISKPFRRIISFGMIVLEKICNSIFDGIITVIPEIAKRFDNVECIYNYPIISSLARRNNKEFTFGYAGGLSKIRCFYEMIEAANKSGQKLNIAGSFETIALKKYFDEHKSDNVQYEGLLDKEQMKKFYQSIDCGLVLFQPVPNHLNAQPVKMKEYMEAGIPFIASDFPKWVEFVNRYKCGICVDPLDINKVVEAMLFMQNNPEKAIEMGNNGRRAVESEYNWEIEEKKLLDFYEKILG